MKGRRAEAAVKVSETEAGAQRREVSEFAATLTGAVVRAVMWREKRIRLDPSLAFGVLFRRKIKQR